MGTQKAQRRKSTVHLSRLSAGLLHTLPPRIPRWAFAVLRYPSGLSGVGFSARVWEGQWQAGVPGRVKPFFLLFLAFRSGGSWRNMWLSPSHGIRLPNRYCENRRGGAPLKRAMWGPGLREWSDGAESPMVLAGRIKKQQKRRVFSPTWVGLVI